MRIQVIAQQAGMSMWHFRRVFSAALGQPVMDYVRRHSRALEALTNTSRLFSDIALDHGFGTQQDYTFTFKDIKKPNAAARLWGGFFSSPTRQKTRRAASILVKNRPSLLTKAA